MNAMRVAIVIGTLSSALDAQSGRVTGKASDPIFKVSRFDETWPSAPRGASPLRSLKHIDLLSDGSAWLTIGGSARARWMSYRNFQVSDASAMQNDYTESRTILSADLRIARPSGRYVRLFAEGRDAQGYGRTLPGGIRVNEADRSDWQNALAEAGSGATFVRYGRQELSVGRERLVGVADWMNARRSFEGWRGVSTVGALRVDVFDGRVVAVRTLSPDRPDSTTHLRVATAGSASERAAARTFQPALWQSYAVDLETRNGLDRRVTAGVRSLWRTPLGRGVLSIEAEAASQRGHLAGKTVDAWFGVLEATTAWRAVRWSPSVMIGVDVASGTGADSARHADTFQPPYATAHAFNGIADVFGRGNLFEQRAGLGAEPFAALQLQAVARRFARVRIEDGVYTKTNSVMRAAGRSTARAVADEFDLTATMALGRYLQLQAGFAIVQPGAFLRETGAAAQERFAVLGTAVTF